MQKSLDRKAVQSTLKFRLFFFIDVPRYSSLIAAFQAMLTNASAKYLLICRESLVMGE